MKKTKNPLAEANETLWCAYKYIAQMEANVKHLKKAKEFLELIYTLYEVAEEDKEYAGRGLFHMKSRSQINGRINELKQEYDWATIWWQKDPIKAQIKILNWVLSDKK